MKFLVPFLLLLFTLTVQADSATGPLIVSPPAEWTVTYDGSNGGQRYNLTKNPGESVLLMFSKWPAPGDDDQIPGFLDTMATKFLNVAKTNPKIKLESNTYTKGDYIGDPFSGKYVVFTVKGGMKQIMFMFSDGKGIWNGTYTGSADGWNEVMEILKGIKKA